MGQRCRARAISRRISASAIGSWASYSRNLTRRPSWLSRTTPTKDATAPSRLPATELITPPASIGLLVRNSISPTRRGRDERHLGAVSQPRLPLPVLLVDGTAERGPHRQEPRPTPAQLGEDRRRGCPLP